MKCPKCGAVYSTTVYNECPKCKAKAPVQKMKNVVIPKPTPKPTTVSQPANTPVVAKPIPRKLHPYEALTKNAKTLSSVMLIFMVLISIAILSAFIGSIVMFTKGLIILGVVMLFGAGVMGFGLWIMFLFTGFLSDYTQHVKLTTVK